MVFRPYLEAAYLDHGYAFFAPDPGPSHLVRYELEFDDGGVILAPEGAAYIIESSTNLTSWTPLQTNTATSGDNIFIDVHYI